MNTIAWLLIFAGGVLLKHAAHEIQSVGISRTFQNVELFSRMSVLDNVRVGLHVRHGTSGLYFLGAAVGLPLIWRRERAMVEEARAALRLVGLDESYDERHVPVRGRCGQLDGHWSPLGSTQVG